MNSNLFKSVKESSSLLSHSTLQERNAALLEIASTLIKEKKRIMDANKCDVDSAIKNGESSALIARLKYTDEKIEQSLKGLKEVQSLPDSVWRVREKREIDSGFVLEKVAVPIGVIGTVFEARPDAVVQIASLALKSGNGLILKGGSEAANTNRVLVEVIKEATESFSFSSSWIAALETRDDVKDLLKADEWVDLIIPRGSNSFVRYIMDNTHIPVLGHAEGLCITYVERSADVEKSVKVLLDAKTQYPAACNATETILVDKEIAPALLPLLSRAFDSRGVVVHADEISYPYFKNAVHSTSVDYDTEYLKKECALKVVSSFDEAIEHIKKHSSGHTDAILTEDKKKADEFLKSVDSADVFVNCSTRFADGYRFGLGAEVGISTSRIHARGPVGLDGLMTTKWILSGHGETVTEYSGEGARSFHFRELDV